MNLRLSLSLLSAALCATGGVVLAAESAPKPGAAKTEKEKKSGAAAALESLNLKKQDERNQEKLKETLKELEEVGRKYQATEREGKRLDKKTLDDLKDVKDLDDAKEKLKKAKEGLSKEDKAVVDDLAKTTKKAMDDLGEEAKKKLAEEKKKAAQKNATAKASPRSAPSDPVRKPAVTFDQVPPAPAPKVDSAEEESRGKKVIKQDEFIRADDIIAPGNRDPKNPDRVLPESDVRTRTYYLKGNVKVRMENFAQDSDELIVILPPGSSGLNSPSGADGNKPRRSGKGDPVQIAAAPDEDGPPVERMIATGHVVTIRRDPDGKIQRGAGGRMTYDGKTGNTIITDYPEAMNEAQAFIAKEKDAQIIMSKKNGLTATGCDFKKVEEAKGKMKKLSPVMDNALIPPSRPSAAAASR